MGFILFQKYCNLKVSFQEIYNEREEKQSETRSSNKQRSLTVFQASLRLLYRTDLTSGRGLTAFTLIG